MQLVISKSQSVTIIITFLLSYIHIVFYAIMVYFDPFGLFWSIWSTLVHLVYLIHFSPFSILLVHVIQFSPLWFICSTWAH